MTEITTFSDSEIKQMLRNNVIDLDKLFAWWHASDGRGGATTDKSITFTTSFTFVDKM